MGYELVREGELNTMYIPVKGILVWGGYKDHTNEEGGTQSRKPWGQG